MTFLLVVSTSMVRFGKQEILTQSWIVTQIQVKLGKSSNNSNNVFIGLYDQGIMITQLIFVLIIKDTSVQNKRYIEMKK
jgi:hypothetical protein